MEPTIVAYSRQPIETSYNHRIMRMTSFFATKAVFSIVFVLLFCVLCLLALEANLGARWHFLLWWIGTGILPAWCLASCVQTPQTRDIFPALVLLGSFVVPALFLFFSNYLFHVSFSLQSAVYFALFVFLGTLLYRFVIRRYDGNVLR